MLQPPQVADAELLNGPRLLGPHRDSGVEAVRGNRRAPAGPMRIVSQRPPANPNELSRAPGQCGRCLGPPAPLSGGAVGSGSDQGHWWAAGSACVVFTLGVAAADVTKPAAEPGASFPAAASSSTRIWSSAGRPYSA